MHLSQPTFYGGWPIKSCTHTGIFPSVSGPSAVKRKLRKVPIYASDAATENMRNVCKSQQTELRYDMVNTTLALHNHLVGTAASVNPPLITYNTQSRLSGKETCLWTLEG